MNHISDEKLAGTVSSIIFRNEDNGYTVFSVAQDSQNKSSVSLIPDDEPVAVGNIASIVEGEKLELFGEWVEHNLYGEQFKFSTFNTLVPKTEDEIRSYLSSGLIYGVGKATAKNIVNMFGIDTLDVLMNNAESLSKVKGISIGRAEQIVDSFREQNYIRDAVIQLQSFGLSSKQSVKLAKEGGQDIILKIKNDPYKIIELVDNYGFGKADQIAMNMGIAQDSDLRIAAAGKYVLRKAANGNGHTCLPESRLLDELSELLPTCSLENITACVESLVISGEIKYLEIDGNLMVALPWIHGMESFIAMKLLELYIQDEKKTVDLEMEISALEAENGFVLDDTQKNAVISAFTHNLCVITGGPGTGKTTILKVLLQVLKVFGMNVILAAPTGRAAKKLSEVSGYDASTIHRLLGYTGEFFHRDEDDPLDCDAIIIDEMSMVDTWLMYHLLLAVPENTKVIMVGDADQLPSVGAGDVLRDLIQSEKIPVVRLTKIYRQGARSRIISNAHLINSGEMPELDYSGDFAFQQINNKDTVLQRVLNICGEGKLGSLSNDLQVLTPMRQGGLGVNNLNKKIQELVNPPKRSVSEITFGVKTYREGDKIMQIKNNYSIEWQRLDDLGREEGTGAFNGDMGIISRIFTQDRELEILFDDDRLATYSYDMLEEIEHAYAITIHKSQGSEFPVVLIPLCDAPRLLLTRNLLYTAVTRASKMVVIIGWQQSIAHMVENASERTRFTSLISELDKFAELI